MFKDQGEFLRKLREEKGLSAGRLSLASGVDRAIISRAENGFIRLPSACAMHIADSLGVARSSVIERLGYLTVRPGGEDARRLIDDWSISFEGVDYPKSGE